MTRISRAMTVQCETIELISRDANHEVHDQILVKTGDWIHIDREPRDLSKMIDAMLAQITEVRLRVETRVR